MKSPTFFPRFAFILMVSYSVILSGCATKAPPPLDMTQLPDVAETVLSEAVYYTQLFSLCAKLGDEAEIEALTKQQDWLAANGNLVMSADQTYTQSYVNESFNYNNKSILPQALRIKQKASTKADQELKLSTRTPANQQKTCLFRLSKITADNIKLTSIPAVATYEQAILANTPKNINQIGDVPTLAGGIDINTPPGKTHFLVKQQNERECDNAYTLILDNNWPNEAYANFCEDELIQVIICEWGNCNPK